VQALLGILALQDRPRETAKSVVQQLRELGIRRTKLITGDNDNVARAVSAELGIDDYRAELMSEARASRWKSSMIT